MSGSPVYVDGKLLGAVAYGWSFTNSKVGMITPIGDMLKLWNVPAKEEIRPFNARESSLIPVQTPLMASGFDNASMEWMKEKLPQYQFLPVDTATAVTDSVAQPLQAGSSVAAAFVNGDMKLGAIGTVTYVDGDHIVAFGHPFLKKGSINYFMHNAYILRSSIIWQTPLSSVLLVQKSAVSIRTAAPVLPVIPDWHRESP